jgi:hypothetical protein
MNISEISVTYGRKVNLGNDQSATIGITFTASVDEAESRSEANERLFTMARDAVHAEMARLPRPVEGPSKAVSGPVHVPHPNGAKPSPAPVKAPGVAADPPFQPSGGGQLLC